MRAAESCRFKRLTSAYSRCIDEGSISYGLEAGNSGQQAQSDPYDLARDKGRCDFLDVKENFTGSATYLLPVHGNRAIEGWRLSLIAMAHTGLPFSVQDGFDRVDLNNAAGAPGERPNAAPGFTGSPIVGQVNEWFNPAAFALQPAGFLGILDGTRYKDLGLSTLTRRSRRILESRKIQRWNFEPRPST